MDEVCRVCLGSGEMVSLFESTNPIQLSDKLMSCASVQILPGDDLPSKICTKCKERLDSSYEFKIQCQHSDSKLRGKYYLELPYPNALMCVKNEISVNEFESPIKSEVDSEDINNDGCNQDVEIIETIHTRSKKKNTVAKKRKKRRKPGENKKLHNESNLQKKISKIHNTDSCSIMDNDESNSDSFPSSESPNVENISCKKAKKDLRRDKSNKPSKEQCFTCGKVMSSRFRLKMHMRIHTGEKPFSCGFCQKTFALSQNLKVHERVHTGEKPLLCGACGKSFAQSAGLVAHTRLHTGETPYACSLCSASFRTPGHLQYHIRQHTGEKRFVCGVCNRAFITRGDLKQHTKTHTGERPYVCTTCGLRLSRSSHLTRHMMTHTGEKPHKCTDCGSGYAQKGDLLRHIKKHALHKTSNIAAESKNNKIPPLVVLDKKIDIDNKISIDSALRSSLMDARMSDDARALGFSFSVGLITTPNS